MSTEQKVALVKEAHQTYGLNRALEAIDLPKSSWYYHPVLEAKLVTPTGLVFSLMTESIENPAENPTKQDCELKAFPWHCPPGHVYRLAERLKHRWPRLSICLLLDGLFAGGPTFSICERNHWKYLIVLQEDDIPYINVEFRALSP